MRPKHRQRLLLRRIAHAHQIRAVLGIRSLDSGAERDLAHCVEEIRCWVGEGDVAVFDAEVGFGVLKDCGAVEGGRVECRY